MRVSGGTSGEPSALELNTTFARVRNPDEVVGGALGSIEPEPATGFGDADEVPSASTLKRHGSS